MVMGELAQLGLQQWRQLGGGFTAVAPGKRTPCRRRRFFDGLIFADGRASAKVLFEVGERGCTKNALVAAFCFQQCEGFFLELGTGEFGAHEPLRLTLRQIEGAVKTSCSSSQSDGSMCSAPSIRHGRI